MPNWCNNSITITGPADQMKTLWETAKTAQNGDFGLLQAMVPMPEALRGTTSPDPLPEQGNYKGPQPEIDGSTNWYDWAVNNWGTKWDVDSEGLEFEDTEDGYATISGWFDSAWAPPIQAYNTFLEQNKEMSIRANYEEGGMDFAGIYEDGDDDYMEGISDPCEAIVRGTETLEEQTDLFKRLEEEFELIENRREYIEEQMLEEDEEKARVDEKRGLYAEHEDVAN